LGVHDIAPGARCVELEGADVQADGTGAMQPRQIEVIESGHRAALAAKCETGHGSALEGEMDQIGVVEYLLHQPAVLQIVGGQGRAVFSEQAADLLDLALLPFDQLATAQQFMGHMVQGETFE